MKKRIVILLLGVVSFLPTQAQKIKTSLAEDIKELESLVKVADSEYNSGNVYIGCIRRTIPRRKPEKMNILPYKKVDIRLLKEITIPSAHPIIYSSVPGGSYELLPVDSTSSKLIIKDANRFWKESRELDIYVSCDMPVDSTGRHTHGILPNMFDVNKCKMMTLPKNEDITFKLKSLKAKTKKLSVYRDSLEQLCADLDQKLNSCYILVASRQKLKEIGLTPSMLNGARVKWDSIDEKYFRTYDMRRVTEIEINSKKPKIITPVYSSSYRKVVNDNGTSTLIITDSGLFWSSSRYLIIQE